jgi:hypothetical protein
MLRQECKQRKAKTKTGRQRRARKASVGAKAVVFVEVVVVVGACLQQHGHEAPTGRESKEKGLIG